MSKLGLAVIECKVLGRNMKCKVNLLTNTILDNPQSLNVTLNDGKVTKVSFGDTIVDSFVVLKQYKLAPQPSASRFGDVKVSEDNNIIIDN